MKLTISAKLHGIHRATLRRYFKSSRVSKAEFADEVRRQTAAIEKMDDRIERLEQALLTLPARSPQTAPTSDDRHAPDQCDPHGLRSLARAIFDAPQLKK